MIIVDAELEKRESSARPIRVGLIGAGYFGRGIAHQLLRPALGMRLAAIFNRTITKAEGIIREAGVQDFVRVCVLRLSSGPLTVHQAPIIRAGKVDTVLTPRKVTTPHIWIRPPSRRTS
jgi:predicted homoserine dehydrogenase-like protein